MIRMSFVISILMVSSSYLTGQATSRLVEQTNAGKKKAVEIVASFDGLGDGFEGPQGSSGYRNPSDNSLAVGPDHIMQTVNSRMAIFTKKGNKFTKSGEVLYGPVPTNNVFRGFGGPCEKFNNGDAVVRYDQLENRWLVVMPIFRRLPPHKNQPEQENHSQQAMESVPWIVSQPGEAVPLYQPPVQVQKNNPGFAGNREERVSNDEPGTYCMCYAISEGPDPFGPYYRYAFVRPLFPDYPRPAIWIDGYYNPSSSGDHVIQKHACVVEREKMLKGLPAKEICFIVEGSNFLNNADIDGFQLPDNGDPNIMMATGGAQLNNVFADDGIYTWKFYTNWENPSDSKLEGPVKIEVEPYNYLGNGQLTKTIPQPGVEQKLDAQGDKIMSRLVYRRIDKQESIVGVHSINTSSGNGGVRWYEFRLDDEKEVKLYQQGTFAPDNLYRWMASPAMDKFGNIGIGYSYGGETVFPGQRFAARQANDPKGILTHREAILINGEASQSKTMRWMDYTTTALDPTDDHTIWYVGDYLKKGSENYSTKIGAFRIPNIK